MRSRTAVACFNRVRNEQKLASTVDCHGLIEYGAGLLLLLLLKKVSSEKLRESDIHPVSPKTPAPQYQPIDRKKRKEKSRRP